MPILNKKPPKVKVTNKPTVKAAPTPAFTPGSLTPDALTGLASRRVKYGLDTGRDEYGNSTGLPGFIEQQRLARVGDINAQRVVSERNRVEGLDTSDNNAAARGVGRSGIRAVARGKVEAAALDREGAFKRAEDQANLDARMANADADYNFANDNLALRRQGEMDAYSQYMQQNPNPGAQPASTKPSWSEWVRTHPWAKTPAQRKVLRANYDRMG